MKNPPLDRLALLVEYLRPVVSEFVFTIDNRTKDADVAPLFTWPGVRYNTINWRDDFAWARNQGLPLVTGDWTLMVDPDELPSLAMMSHIKWVDTHPDDYSDAFGWVYWFKNFWDGTLGEEKDYHWHTRLFRSGTARFYRPVHELVMFNIDGQDLEENPLRGTPVLPYAPKEAYCIHSKSRESIKEADELYARLGEVSK